MIEEISNYPILIDNDENKSMQEIIIVQKKGDRDLVSGHYSFEKNSIIFRNKSVSLRFKNFPTHLMELIDKEIAVLVFIEVAGEVSLDTKVRGNIFNPSYDRKQKYIWDIVQGL